MIKMQRVGLAILMIALIMTTLFAGKPELTSDTWGALNITGAIMSIIGAVLFISG